MIVEEKIYGVVQCSEEKKAFFKNTKKYTKKYDIKDDEWWYRETSKKMKMSENKRLRKKKQK